jgi:hypothetical protein
MFLFHCAHRQVRVDNKCFECTSSRLCGSAQKRPAPRNRLSDIALFPAWSLFRLQNEEFFDLDYYPQNFCGLRPAVDMTALR